MIRVVHRSLVERRLAEVSDRLRALREELRVIDEQLVHLGDDADDAGICGRSCRRRPSPTASTVTPAATPMP